MRTNKAVFLDRDGTLIEERNYLSDPEEVRLFPGAAKALKTLSEAGFLLVIITNQSGIGRGYFSIDALKAVHCRLLELLSHDDVNIDGIYFCPHSPQEMCSCRKPEKGLVDKACGDFDIDPSLSYVIGDKGADVRLALTCGSVPILVKTGYGKEEEKKVLSISDSLLVASDLSEATDLILNLEGKKSRMMNDFNV